MNDALELRTASPEETREIGRRLATMLPRGSLVALEGDLATGKTQLVMGMAAHFGADAAVHSPTFTLVNEYGGDPVMLHLDLYRLHGPEDVIALGHEEIFEQEGVCVVEWAERAEGLLPARRVSVRLEHAGGDGRLLRVHDAGLLPPDWRDRLRAAG